MASDRQGLFLRARRSNSRRKWQCFSSISVLGTAFLAVTSISTLWVLLVFTGSAFIPSPIFLHSSSLLSPRKILENKPEDPNLGFFGDLMISFLREDLPFTIFVPSAASFQRMFQTLNRKAANISDNYLKVGSNDSHAGSELKPSDVTFALVSRIFGFCAIPRRILSSMVPVHGELALESVSGYRLYVSRQTGGALTVNNLVSSRIDMIRGSIVIHFVDGIIMDSEFEQSFMPYNDAFQKEDEMHQ